MDDLFSMFKETPNEKLMRNVFNLCDELYLELIFHKYPLTADRQQYKLNICRRKILEDKLINLKCFQGTEFDKIFREAQKYLEKYKAEHREYNLTKPERGGYL